MKKEATFSDSEIERIRAIVREELNKPHDTMVIRPAMSGRKLDAQRERISCSVDKVIDEALRVKARELRGPVGVVIETALWEYLGRPTLSFEKEKEPNKPLQIELPRFLAKKVD
jgi:hypothetical protein